LTGLRAAVTTALASALLASGARGAQEPRPAPPDFGSAVDVVRLEVSVLLSDGRVVTDLGADDFEIYEDGERQAPALFVRRELPLSLVLVLDSSASIASRLSFSKAAASGFLDALRPGDEASVVAFDDRVRVLQPPTSDRSALRRAVDEVAAGGSTALYNTLYTVLRSLPGAPPDAELRRRAVVLLSDGEDTSSLIWEEQVVELARRREATVHVIALRPRDEDTATARLLSALSRESGGEVHYPASARDLDAVYSRIGEELKNQYTLGYVSSRPVHDSRWRRIEVRVPGRRGLHLRHRTGYYSVP
jgi:Ca-activated chloride channel family protein